MTTKRRAFSILELTIVLAIMGILAGVGIARAGAGRADYRARLAAQKLASDLRDAASQSFHRSTTVTVHLDTLNNRYTLANLLADGETVTVDLSEYDVRLTAASVNGGDTISYAAGVASTDQPIMISLDSGVRVFDVQIAAVLSPSDGGAVDVVSKSTDNLLSFVLR